jgi:hypothetical protein
MRFLFSRKHLMLAVVLGVAVGLALMPSSAHAMVGAVPAMPQVEQTTVTSSGGQTDTSQGTTTESGSTPGTPAGTPEPPALLSGLLGLGLLGAYHVICRGIG